MSVLAQDVIVKKDGNIIRSKVLEVTPSDIKYKKESNPNGPTYTIHISDVMSINYENGENEHFENNSANKENTTEESRFVYKPADARNAELIKLYNRTYVPSSKIKTSDKSADRCLIIVGVKESSIMSNGEVEMKLIGKKERCSSDMDVLCYGLEITNKSNRTIYIDKGNCFRVCSDSPSYCYFTEQGSIYSASKGFPVQRIIAIPGESSCILTQDKWKGHHLVEAMERFRFKYVLSDDIGLHRGSVKLGQVQTFKEDELPWTRRYTITYSQDERFSIYSVLNADFYIREVIGCQKFSSKTSFGLVEGELNFETFIDEYNKYTIIGYHIFDKESSNSHSSSYAKESLGESGENQVELVNAISSAALSTVNAFTQKQGGVPVHNGSISTSGRETVTSSSYDSDDTPNNSQKEPSKRKCGVCGGKGSIVEYTAGFGLSTRKYCSDCGKDVDGTHYHKTCTSCHGKGYK